MCPSIFNYGTWLRIISSVAHGEELVKALKALKALKGTSSIFVIQRSYGSPETVADST